MIDSILILTLYLLDMDLVLNDLSESKLPKVKACSPFDPDRMGSKIEIIFDPYFGWRYILKRGSNVNVLKSGSIIKILQIETPIVVNCSLPIVDNEKRHKYLFRWRYNQKRIKSDRVRDVKKWVSTSKMGITIKNGDHHQKWGSTSKMGITIKNGDQDQTTNMP
jgi:hypothetical protein